MNGDRKFLPVGGIAPAFNSSAVGSTSVSYALQSTVRMFLYPSERNVRIVSRESYSINFGTSDVSADTNSAIIPAKSRAFFGISPGHTHIAFISTANAIINVGLGVGVASDVYTIRATSTEIPSTTTIFTIQEAGSITHVYWLDPLASWTIGDAAHILGMYHYSTST